MVEDGGFGGRHEGAGHLAALLGGDDIGVAVGAGRGSGVSVEVGRGLVGHQAEARRCSGVVWDSVWGRAVWGVPVWGMADGRSAAWAGLVFMHRVMPRASEAKAARQMR